MARWNVLEEIEKEGNKESNRHNLRSSASHLSEQPGTLRALRLSRRSLSLGRCICRRGSGLLSLRLGGSAGSHSGTGGRAAGGSLARHFV
jgi:hypothetical protein